MYLNVIIIKTFKIVVYLSKIFTVMYCAKRASCADFSKALNILWDATKSISIVPLGCSMR